MSSLETAERKNKITIEITDEMIFDTLCSHDNVCALQFKSRTCLEDVVEGNGDHIMIDSETGKEYTINRKAILSGLNKAPFHLIGDMISGNYDCVTADGLFQLACLGEIIYG